MKDFTSGMKEFIKRDGVYKVETIEELRLLLCEVNKLGIKWGTWNLDDPVILIRMETAFNKEGYLYINFRQTWGRYNLEEKESEVLLVSEVIGFKYIVII